MHNKLLVKLIKKLRKKTQISINKCKEALIIHNYDYKKSLKYLKYKFTSFTKKHIKEGFILNKTKNKKSCMIIIKCESDFVAQNIYITNFAKQILKYSFMKKKISFKLINKKFDHQAKQLSTKLSEYIKISNFCCLEGNYVTNYLHNNNKIGTIIKAKKINKNKKINIKKIKKVAMHITALNPLFKDSKDVSVSYKKKIRDNMYLLHNTQTKNFIEKKIKEKINKKILTHQIFIFDNKKLIKDYFKENNFIITKFYRFQIHN